MDKSNKFTKKAENSIKNAIDIARNLGHTYIGSEHILLGILSEKNSVAAAALDELGIVLNDLEALVRDEIGTGAVTTVSKEDFTAYTFIHFRGK